MYFYKAMQYRVKRPGVAIKGISGERCQMQCVRLEARFSTTHRHPEEQIGYIVSGEIAITIAGETQICESGDGYYIPAQMEHTFAVLSADGAEIVDIFSPPKEENKL